MWFRKGTSGMGGGRFLVNTVMNVRVSNVLGSVAFEWLSDYRFFRKDSDPWS
jgi:hypothetical protein